MALAGTTEESTGSIQLQTVREAYTETVMSVPHYEREYGESLQANMAAELGTEVARQVVDGQQLTPMLYETLVAAGERGVTERKEFVELLREEQRSLTTVQSKLDEVESQAAEIRGAIEDGTREASLSDCDDELTVLETTCSDLAEDRQQLLHRRSAARLSGIDGESLVRFLYIDCEATCPALADIADCIETIRAHRKRCLR
jgi:polyhydroxyalkanoate synthesis regulator phasin